MTEFIEELTERETEVIYYVMQSLTNKQIAEVLGITHHTVKAHISSILKKLMCKNRIELALFAQARGLSIHHQGLAQP